MVGLSCIFIFSLNFNSFYPHSLSHFLVLHSEFTLWTTDTFEIMVQSSHIRYLDLILEPKEMFGPINQSNRRYWCETVPAYLDGVARKHLLYMNNPSAHLFLKGHFLPSVPTLALRYPDATFLTMIRSPTQSLQSFINFLRVTPCDPFLGPFPWDHLRRMIPFMVQYYQDEQTWYTKEDGTRKIVLRFSDYIRDLKVTMGYLYGKMERPIPMNIPMEHHPRNRKGYAVDRLLSAIGVKEEVIREELKGYFEWCDPVLTGKGEEGRGNGVIKMMGSEGGRNGGLKEKGRGEMANREVGPREKEGGEMERREEGNGVVGNGGGNGRKEDKKKERRRRRKEERKDGRSE